MKNSKLVVIGAVLTGLMVGLYFDPYTGWLVRRELPVSVQPWWSGATLSAAEAARRPNDYAVNLAVALASPTRVLPALEMLVVKFGDHPSLYAHLIRHASVGAPHLARDEPDEMYGKPLIPQAVLSAAAVGDLIRMADWAERGEQRDPDNAYFPYMRAAVLFALHQDTEANREVAAASHKQRWDDYFSEELRSVDDEIMHESGRQPYLTMMFRHSLAGAMQHYWLQREAARFVVYEAAQLEKSGQPQQGLVFRDALLRCAGLMRAGSKTVKSSFMAENIANVSLSYLYGRKNMSPASSSAESDISTRARESERTLKLFRAYAESLNHPEEARFAAGQIAAGVECRTIVSRSTEGSAMGIPFSGDRWIAFWWIASAALLSSASLVLALLLFGPVLRQPATVRRGVLFTGWLGITCLFVWAGAARWNSGDECLLQMLGLAMVSPDGVVQDTIISLIIYRPWAGNLFAVLTIIPIVGAIGLGWAVNRFMISQGARDRVRARQHSFVPLLAVLVAAYAGSVIALARAEDHATQQCRLIAANECQYYAHLEGKEWPGVVR